MTNQIWMKSLCWLVLLNSYGNTNENLPYSDEDNWDNNFDNSEIIPDEDEDEEDFGFFYDVPQPEIFENEEEAFVSCRDTPALHSADTQIHRSKKI